MKVVDNLLSAKIFDCVHIHIILIYISIHSATYKHNLLILEGDSLHHGTQKVSLIARRKLKKLKMFCRFSEIGVLADTVMF